MVLRLGEGPGGNAGFEVYVAQFLNKVSDGRIYPDVFVWFDFDYSFWDIDLLISFGGTGSLWLSLGEEPAMNW